MGNFNKILNVEKKFWLNYFTNDHKNALNIIRVANPIEKFDIIDLFGGKMETGRCGKVLKKIKMS